MIQKLALLLTLSAVTSTIAGIDTWHIACVYALFLAWGWVCTREGYDDAMELSQAILHKANDMLKEAKELRDIKGQGND
jgi:hypothetical protein